MKRPDDNNPKSISHKLRKKRFSWIEDILYRMLETQDEVKILDIGGRAKYWNLMDEALRPKVHVTIANLAEDEFFGVMTPEGLNVEHVVANGCDMPQFADKSFDLCHSNSVIEHVGSLQNMIAFAAESQRVSREYFHQTPSLWFPIEPHYGFPFLHWLPKAARASALATFKLGYGTRAKSYQEAFMRADHTEIITPGQMRALFPNGEMLKERFALMVKSVAVRGISEGNEVVQGAEEAA